MLLPKSNIFHQNKKEETALTIINNVIDDTMHTDNFYFKDYVIYICDNIKTLIERNVRDEYYYLLNWCLREIHFEGNDYAPIAELLWLYSGY